MRGSLCNFAHQDQSEGLRARQGRTEKESGRPHGKCSREWSRRQVFVGYDGSKVQLLSVDDHEMGTEDSLLAMASMAPNGPDLTPRVIQFAPRAPPHRTPTAHSSFFIPGFPGSC